MRFLGLTTQTVIATALATTILRKRLEVRLFFVQGDAESRVTHIVIYTEVEGVQGIQDRTETNLVNLRRTIYLTIMNSLTYEEAVHKLMKVQINEGQEVRIFLVFDCARAELSYV